jgi:hypothetical protein
VVDFPLSAIDTAMPRPAQGLKHPFDRLPFAIKERIDGKHHKVVSRTPRFDGGDAGADQGEQTR